jgi:uncharacterized membrane protein
MQLGGHHIAVIGSLMAWLAVYLVTLGFLFTKFSNRFSLLAQGKTIAFISKPLTVAVATILAPLLAGLLYRLGGYVEHNNGIAWGCYIESFWLGVLLLWVALVIIEFLAMLIGLISPKALLFENRKNLFISFLICNIYAIFVSLLFAIAIDVISGPLSGKTSSCW